MPLDKRCCWVCRFVAGLAAVAIPRRQDVVPDSVSLLERTDGERIDGEGVGVERAVACEADAAA